MLIRVELFTLKPSKTIRICTAWLHCTTRLQVASVWQGLWMNSSTLITMAIGSGPVSRKCLLGIVPGLALWPTYLGHPAHASDKQHLFDVRLADLGVLQSLLARVLRALDQILGQGLKLGPRQLQVHVLRAWLVHRQVWQVDVSLKNTQELWNK